MLIEQPDMPEDVSSIYSSQGARHRTHPSKPSETIVPARAFGHEQPNVQANRQKRRGKRNEGCIQIALTRTSIIVSFPELCPLGITA
jgi:hypothetical protein